MDSTYKTLGIVIKRKDWRENDSLFTFYTEKGGRMEAVAVGSKKIQSKLMGHLSSFGLVDLMIARGRTFDRVAQARLIKVCQPGKSADYNFFLSVQRFFDFAVVGHEPDAKVWRLLELFLVNYNKTDHQPTKQFLKLNFFLKMIEYLGYRPELHQCVECGKKQITKTFFSVQGNGLICHQCSGVKIAVLKETVIFLRLLYHDPEMLTRVVFSMKIMAEASSLVSDIISRQFNAPFKLEL